MLSFRHAKSYTACWHVCKLVARAASQRVLTLFLIEKLMKLVSTRTWYGGPSWVLYLKNNAAGVFSL